jgi:hypothetical protein
VGHEERWLCSEEKEKGKKDPWTSLISNWDNLSLGGEGKLHTWNKYRSSCNLKRYGGVCSFCKKEHHLLKRHLLKRIFPEVVEKSGVASQSYEIEAVTY